jgi:RimJ/RimL family protein N-acetyltransferase
MELRLVAEDVELRLPDDREVDELAEVAVAGVHELGRSPFAADWTVMYPPTLRRNVAQDQWRNRGAWKVQDWRLTLAVFVDGRVVGCQEVSGERFPVRRRVQTASWLGLAHQGQGIGTTARAAVLSFAFDLLEARTAHSDALEGNVASQRVSERLGYRPNGFDVAEREDQRVHVLRYCLTAEDWVAQPRPPVRVDGFDACRDLFGLPFESADGWDEQIIEPVRRRDRGEGPQ